MKSTTWKSIPGCPYEASDDGNIRRVGKAKVLKQYKRRQNGRFGYYFLRLSLGSKEDTKLCSAHSLIARAFIGERPAGYHINHIDGNSLNNTPGNLEYVTPRENVQHAAAMGVMPRGENHHWARITESTVREIRRLSDVEGLGWRRIARALHLGTGAVRNALSGQTWKHVEWEYPRRAQRTATRGPRKPAERAIACSRGHTYSPETTWVYGNRRKCKLCAKLRDVDAPRADITIMPLPQ